MHVAGAARADVRALRAATALARAGMRVSIIDLEPDTARPREEDLDGVHLRHIFMPSWFIPTRFKPWFLTKLARVILYATIPLLRVSVDSYFAFDLDALPACFLAARLRRRPLIFDAYELPLDDPQLRRRRRLYALAERTLRMMLPGCAGVIVVSPPIVGELQRRFGGKPAVVVRNIPAYQAPASSDRLRQRLGLPPETRIALYQGNLSEDRSLETLVYAARHLAPGVAIVLLGAGPVRPRLEALIAREGAGDRVFILPPVPYAELLAWTASADLGLCVFAPDYSASIRLALPNKLFEYLMAGLPVLTTPLPAVEELITQYDVGRVVASAEPEAVGRAISATLADPAGLAGMRRNALAAAERELHWEAEQARLIHLVESIMASRLRSSAGKARSQCERKRAAHG